MTVGAKRLVEESLFFVSLFSRTRQLKKKKKKNLPRMRRGSKYGCIFTAKFKKKDLIGYYNLF